MGSFQKFCLRWNNHTSNLLGTLGHILASEQHSDVTLCCQGSIWHLHKLVLCASSSHLEKLLLGLPMGQTPIIVLDGPQAEDVASLIHFIYHGEVNVDQENLASLLRTAESLKIKGLAEVSSVTSATHDLLKNGMETDATQNRPSRGRQRTPLQQPGPVYATVSGEYQPGVYGLTVQAQQVMEQQQLPAERDPSPLNLSFSSSIHNVHDETPEERQERRNRLDDLLYAATERSKKEERREARREAREAAIREAASGVRDTSSLQDPSLLPPAAKRSRTTEATAKGAPVLNTHPAYHIPIVSLNVPLAATAAVNARVTAQSPSPAHTPQKSGIISTVDLATVVAARQHQQLTKEQQIQLQQQHQELSQKAEHPIIMEMDSTGNSTIKAEKIETSSDNGVTEDYNGEESDTQSAPETSAENSGIGPSVSVVPVLNATLPRSSPQEPSISIIPGSTGEDLPVKVTLQSPTLLSVPSCNTSSGVVPSTLSNGPSPSPPSECGSVEEKVTPYFHSILRQVTEGTSTEGAESTQNNAQRVTINMRTFKEEWRRQLLVDYDSRTNMSICMLCFTTFKSYDGPRKNTYVKHAKRFHPSLEEYSEEERDLIINMYEKYHKYDVDMQKEVNKSYRAANAIVALGKKGNKCEFPSGAHSSSSGVVVGKTTGDSDTMGQDEAAAEGVNTPINLVTTTHGHSSSHDANTSNYHSTSHLSHNSNTGTISSHVPVCIASSVSSSSSGLVAAVSAGRSPQPSGASHSGPSSPASSTPTSPVIPVILATPVLISKDHEKKEIGKVSSKSHDGEISLEADEKLSDSFDAEELAENTESPVNNNNISAAHIPKSNKINTRA
ncbi:unnamed protein product, partial [Meganyctiphanes norvegica]